MKTIEERKAILEAEIVKQQKKGWQIVSRTDTNCQLKKERRANGCIAVLLLILFIIPGILYLIFMRDTTLVFFEVNEEGEIKYS
jgi:hypothetical protein